MAPGSTAWRVHVVGVLLALVGLVAAHPLAQWEDFARTRRALTGYAMDDSSIRDAVAAWTSDAATASAMYGHISTWDTSAVTDMSRLFCGRQDFMTRYGIPLEGDSRWDDCTSTSSFNYDISARDTSQPRDR